MFSLVLQRSGRFGLFAIPSEPMAGNCGQQADGAEARAAKANETVNKIATGEQCEPSRPRNFMGESLLTLGVAARKSYFREARGFRHGFCRGNLFRSLWDTDPCAAELNPRFGSRAASLSCATRALTRAALLNSIGV